MLPQRCILLTASVPDICQHSCSAYSSCCKKANLCWHGWHNSEPTVRVGLRSPHQSTVPPQSASIFMKSWSISVREVPGPRWGPIFSLNSSIVSSKLNSLGDSCRDCLLLHCHVQQNMLKQKGSLLLRCAFRACTSRTSTCLGRCDMADSALLHSLSPQKPFSWLPAARD